MPYDHGDANACAHALNVHTCGGGVCTSTKAHGQNKLRAFEPSSIAAPIETPTTRSAVQEAGIFDAIRSSNGFIDVIISIIL
ncbi:hypothetical protein NECAME_07736 [Necator americanus]|uniref:Uncharacterized protein n=1 Tax=Necator americanus TaxID=51031 RepID=W2TPD2_NECAM|nr:hypothetical protein NECAME_07736 [Necator americanus]ETN82842.1 hypothetical protein NECAME_07736 [Necator americanus]